MENSKVIIVTNIPNQYRVPLFNELNNQLILQGKELLVVFAAKSYQARKSIVDLSECNFNYHILGPSIFSSIEQKRGLFFYSGLIRLLLKEKPKTLIVGGFSISSLKVAFLQFFTAFNFIIWSGTFEAESTKAKPVRLIIRKWLISRANHLIAYSTKAKQYFISLGAEEKKVVNVGNTVDVEFFSSIKRTIDELHKENGIYHLTYVGYLTSRKNVGLLLIVVKELKAYRTDFVLDIIGDGEFRLELEQLAKELEISSFINFHGFMQKKNLPSVLTNSAIFLFQTDFDIWGLVLNEAMAVGIPCLASINAGATEDLIQEGTTGFKVDFNDSISVAKKIDYLLRHPLKMEDVGKNASDFIQLNYSLSSCSSRMISVI
jgi:glycosyltransferase involved in cell wall biosynthesis